MGNSGDRAIRISNEEQRTAYELVSKRLTESSHVPTIRPFHMQLIQTQTAFMKLILLVLMMASLWSVSRVHADIIAGPITNEVSGHIYYLLSPTPFLISEAEAIALGGHLVTVEDAEENSWIFTTFSTYGGIQRAIMIGLTDMEEEGNFVWISGSPSTYRNWFPGEPNNSSGIEHFVHMYWPDEGRGATWNDTSGDLGVPIPINGLVEIEPLGAARYDVSLDFSLEANPNGPWSYGWKSSLDGNFSLFTSARVTAFDNGVPSLLWELATFQLPAVLYNPSTTTGTSDGGQGT